MSALSADGTLIAAVQQARASLQQALANQDWERVPQLNEELRQCIGSAMDGLELADSKEVLRQELELLQRLYAGAVEQGRAYREWIAQEMRQLRKGSSAVNQYLTAGGRR